MLLLESLELPLLLLLLLLPLLTDGCGGSLSVASGLGEYGGFLAGGWDFSPCRSVV